MVENDLPHRIFFLQCHLLALLRQLTGLRGRPRSATNFYVSMFFRYPASDFAIQAGLMLTD